MKVTPSMTNESGNLLAEQADFLDIDGQGIRVKRSEFSPDLAEITLDSTAYPNVTGRFSVNDLFGIAAQCIAVAGEIMRSGGQLDPYEEEIRARFTREGQ